MVQTGSAQREPSMEEILASIRRIIEDSDSVRQPNEETHPDLSIAAESDSGEVEAFRAELDDHLTGSSAPTASAVPAGEPGDAPLADIRPLRPAPMATTEAASTPVFASEHSQPEDAVETPEPATTAALSTGAETGARPSIISDSTGRQVAAAFGELSEAFAASRRRSFDEMAEEMLRPMLQDWLDNNLPTLVERLVREEIERVARGGQG